MGHDMRKSVVIALATLGFLACVAPEGVEDGANDPALGAEGKADGETLTSAEVAGVLEVVNTLDKAGLGEAGLTSRVATNISKHRAGVDEQLGTDDDDTFDSLDELDEVPYVGSRVLGALLDYARANGYVHVDDSGGSCLSGSDGQTPAGKPTFVCKKLYDDAPYVRPPADEPSDGDSLGTYYMGIVSMGSGRVAAYDRDGKEWALTTSHGTPYDLDAPVSGLELPNNLQAIFKIRGRTTIVHDDIFGDEDAIAVSSLAPAIWLPGKVLDNRMLGAWEAEVSTYSGDHRYDSEHPVTVRFLITDSTSNNAFMRAFADGAEGQLLSGVIDNWDQGAIAEDGRCLPPINGTSTNPFHGATTPAFSMFRHPDMHGLHDQVIVFSYPSGFDGSINGMGSMDAFSPSALIQVYPTGTFVGPDQINGHGTPNGHIIMHLHKVQDRAVARSCSN
jgi:hypothetical protein